MKLYKNENNEIFAYELDGSQDHIIPGSYIAITNEEADVIRNSVIQTAFDDLSYAEKRIAEYPPMADYLDGIVKGDQAQIDKYINDCLAVKTKYPKE
jgi:hypothetical protein